MKSAMDELGPTSRESQEFSRYFYPVLMPFDLRQQCVWNVVVPYLHRTKLQLTFPNQVFYIYSYI